MDNLNIISILLYSLAGSATTLLVLESRQDIDGDVKLAVSLSTGPAVVALGLWLLQLLGLWLPPSWLLLLLPVLLVSRVLRANAGRTAWLVVVLAVQLLWVQSLEVPLNPDGVQHVLLADTIRITRAVPATLPDSRGSPMMYHFGLHIFAAAATPGNDSFATARVVLLTGPFAITQLASSIYAAGRRMGSPWWASVTGALVGVFAFAMPTLLMNWGRLTLLFALPALIGTVTLATYRATVPHALWMGFLISATLIAHTRSIFIWIAVLPLALILCKNWRWLISGLLPIAVGAWILMSYWSWRQFTTAADWSVVPAEYMQAVPPTAGLYAWRPVEMAWLLLMLAGLLFARSIAASRKLTLVLAILVPTIIALLPPIGMLPGGHVVDASTVYAVIPVVAGIGMSVVLAYHIPTRLARVTLGAATVAVLSLLSARPSVPGNCCILMTADDVQALIWLREQPIGTVAAKGVRQADRLVVGVDGGYWVSTLTQQRTTLPSLFYGFGQADYQYQVAVISEDIQRRVAEGADLCEVGITYVYSGGMPESWSAEALGHHPYLRLAHQSNRVRIYETLCGSDTQMGDNDNTAQIRQ